MARLDPPSPANLAIRQYVEASAIAVALVVCMPIVGIGAFLLRGVVAGAVVLAVVLVGAVGIWHWLEPRLSPGCRAVARDIALGAALLAGIPVLAVAAVALGGVVAMLVPVGVVTLAIAGIWRIVAAGRHMFTSNR